MEEVIRRFLAEEHVHIIRETVKGEFNCRCPLPFHEDKTSSFSINRDSGMWNCFVCGGGNFVQLYAFVKEMPIWDAIGAIREKFGIDITHGPIVTDFPEYEERFRGFFEGDEKLGALSDYFRSRPHDYYLDRGFSKEEWLLWEGGFDPVKNCVVFPVKSFVGGVVGLVGRSVIGKIFMNYEGSHPKSTLYGINMCGNRKTVIVCEGLFDTHRVRRVLGDRVDVVGLLSAEFSQTQLAMLSYWDEIDIWLDNDEAGFEGTRLLCETLLDVGKIVKIVPYFADVKDQAEKGILDRTLVAGWENRMSFVKSFVKTLLDDK